MHIIRFDKIFSLLLNRIILRGTKGDRIDRLRMDHDVDTCAVGR